MVQGFFSVSVMCLLFLFAAISDLQASPFLKGNHNLPDSATAIHLDKKTDISEGFGSRIIDSGAPVSKTDSEEVRCLPANDLSNTLVYLSGISTSATDGTGLQSQLSIRGFRYLLGSESVILMVDGIPINDQEIGFVSWNFLPLSIISSIEVLRGGSSALYGDPAVGGAINLRTEINKKRVIAVKTGIGSFKNQTKSVVYGANSEKVNYSLYINDRRGDGYRENSNWRSTTFGGRVNINLRNNSSLGLSIYNQLLNFGIAGPASERMIKEDPKASAPCYHHDEIENNRHLFKLDFKQKVDKKTNLEAVLAYSLKKLKETKSFAEPPLALDPFNLKPIDVYDTTLYANTLKRSVSDDHGGISIRIFHNNPQVGFKLIGGVEADLNIFDNSVNKLFKGFEYDYQKGYQEIDEPEFAGNGFRFRSAAFISSQIRIFDNLNFFAGLRYDNISEDFSSDIPVADTSMTRTYNALSPRLSLNLSSGETFNYKGNIIISYSNAFKLPTIYQRTDLTRLSHAVFYPAGSGTYQMEVIQGAPFSNGELKQQYNKNYELGINQFYRFSEKFTGEISLTGFVIDVKNEIDFDYKNLKYVNHQETRHAGLEVMISLLYKNSWKGFININSVKATVGTGMFKGKYLPNAPGLSQSIGVVYSPDHGVGGSLVHHGASGIYIDIENSSKLDAYGVLSTRINYRYKWLTLNFDVNNILNNSYSTNGYLLNETRFFYPAAGRSLYFGLQITI